MIIQQFIARHLQQRDDAGFYILPARNALRWIERQVVAIQPSLRVFDLGCGQGIFGKEFLA